MPVVENVKCRGLSVLLVIGLGLWGLQVVSMLGGDYPLWAYLVLLPVMLAAMTLWWLFFRRFQWFQDGMEKQSVAAYALTFLVMLANYAVVKIVVLT